MHGDVVHPAVPSITSPDTSLKWSQSGVRVPLKLALVHALSVSASRTLLSVTEAAVNRNQATVDQAIFSDHRKAATHLCYLSE